jgi:ABC-type multidrug transport system fused ATPase/permease subunit
MSFNHLFDHVPVWVFFLLIALISLVPIEVGQRLGARRRRLAEHEPEGPVGAVVGATLALLGFMVALTLGAATDRFGARKEALIDGVNAIETAYRNASLVPEPHKSEVRKLLRDYVTVRLEMPQHLGNLEQLGKLEVRVRALQAAIWSHAEALADADRSSEIYSLLTSSLNEVFQLYNKRIILGAQHRIPVLVWIILMFVTVITMFGVGFQFGLVGRRSVIANLMLACTFALVMTITFDLDQPGKGLIDVDQKPMHELHERMNATK